MIIAWLIGLLVKRGLSMAFAQFLAPVIVYSILTIVAWFGWNHFVAEPYRAQGRAEIQAKWNRAIDEERERQRDVQEATLKEAEAEIELLRKLEEDLNAKIDELGDRPDDPACGLDADSMRDIQGVR